MNYAIKLSDASHLLDIGRRSMQQNGGEGSTESTSNGSMSTGKQLKLKPKGSNSGRKQAPVCPYGPHKEKVDIK